MNKTVLITGASGGIGLELAKEFAAYRDDLILVARSMDKLKQLQTKIENDYKVKAHIIEKDLSGPDAPLEVYEYIKKEGWQVDYLINNAGIGKFGQFVDNEWASECQMIDLNIKTLTQFCKLYVRDMVEQGGGKIMNVASTAAFMPGPAMAVYFATKAYVLHFSEALHDEVKKKGVTVTALCPGATESGFFKAATMEESGLVKGKKLPTSKEVAKYGYKAMMLGKPVAIHGLKNYILANSVRFTPRSLVVKVVRSMQKVKN